MNGGIKPFKSIKFYIEKYINVHVNNNRVYTSLAFSNVYHTFNVTWSWQHPCVMSIYILRPHYMKTRKLNCLTLSKFIQPAVAKSEPESGSSHTFMPVHTSVLEINHIKCITFLLPVFCSALNIYILEADILFFFCPLLEFYVVMFTLYSESLYSYPVSPCLLLQSPQLFWDYASVLYIGHYFEN